ncbi:hypothetical protein Q5P01_016597 [Channa striata]|uniref:Uncharacterized protein n=1 Tax=Channa striata TaxID=64152 RepID=A0AA88M843_CHASR|nr:hypothetical protein Q5P01_016597 [Channa striata]
MLTRQPPVDINKIQKMWYTLSKGDSAKDKDVYANVKVLFLKLRVYHNKLKKLQPPGERQQSHDTSHSSSDSRAGEPGRAPPEPRELGLDDAVASQGKGDNSGADEREEDVGVESTLGGPPPVPESVLYVTPEATPASHWIKNMSTLLMSDPWLTGDEERREAVCALLRLDETLLNRARSGILGDRTLGEGPSARKEDRCLVGGADPPSIVSPRGSPRAVSGHGALVWRDRDRMESVFLSEAEEASSEEVEDSESEMELGVRGENLVATADRDDESGSSQDEYDYSDDFIDDGPLETGSSSESSGDDACYSTTKRQKVRGLGGRGKKSELVSGRPSSRRGFYSGSEDDDDYAWPITEAADRRDKAPEARYKRAFSSDDSDADESDGKKEGIWRPSKRVKKRDSPSVAHEVVKRRVRGKEPASSHGNRGPGIKSAAAASKSLGRKHFSPSKRKGSWGAHKTVGGVSGSLQKKQQGGKGDQIKSSPYHFRPSASPSGVTRSTDSSPSKKQKGVRVEEGCRRRSSPASTDRPKRAPVTSSTSSSESESRGYLGASGRSANGEFETGPARKEEAKRGRGDGAQTDSYGETKECEENPASREEARRERVDKREVVRSEEEREGEETASSLRPSRAPAVLRQQSRSSSDSDTGVPRKGGKDCIESEYESWNASDTQRSEDERVDSDADSTGDAACVITM